MSNNVKGRDTEESFRVPLSRRVALAYENYYLTKMNRKSRKDKQVILTADLPRGASCNRRTRSLARWSRNLVRHNVINALNTRKLQTICKTFNSVFHGVIHELYAKLLTTGYQLSITSFSSFHILLTKLLLCENSSY